MRSLEVEKKYSTPSPTLSWICSTLPEFRICGFATVYSICSLSGLVTRRPSANPLPLGEGVFRHCERSEFTPEAIQLNVGLVNPTYKEKSTLSLEGRGCRRRVRVILTFRNELFNYSTFQLFNSPQKPCDCGSSPQ